MFEGIHQSQLPAALEALLFVSDEPVSAVTLAKMLDTETAEVTKALSALKQQLEEQERGIQLYEVAGGWRLYTHPAYHELLEQYVLSWDTRKMSAAALEVLAIVAYTQPVTRNQISAIRGVTSDSPLNTLVERGYVREVGTADTPGNPSLYATTRMFLERYGLASVKELPPLEDFAPDEKTAQLIHERLGVPTAQMKPGPQDSRDASSQVPDQLPSMPDERDLPTPERMAAEATASLLGVVEKIDFDQLTFNTDDE